MTRRALLAAPLLARDPDPERPAKLAREGRLLAHPVPGAPGGPTGERPLGLGGKRDGLIYAPAARDPARPAPLVLWLHGAGGSAQGGMKLWRELVPEAGLVALVPDSRDRTWDLVMGGFGPDLAFIDAALRHVFSVYSIDPARIAIAGFSDGASCALSLGIANGNLFTHILAFSPGFMAPPRQEGNPRIFISHGVHDRILPIDNASRSIAGRLKKARYRLTYREFDGPHAVPRSIAREAVEWFAGPPTSPPSTQ